MKELFNSEQKKYILDNYETMKYKDIAKNLNGNFTATQITGWLHNNKHKKENRSIFSNDDKIYIVSNYKNKTYREIAKNLNFSERQIRHFVEHYLENKKRVFNDRYFQYIDTPTKAYWLGYIYADGYVTFNETKRLYEFGMQLQKRDIQVLIDLNKDLGGVHTISEGHFEGIIHHNKNITISDSVRLRVYSKTLVEDLMSHNILCNKTYLAEYPQIDNYFIDFVRGYIDGDGCIYIGKRDYPYISITSYNKWVLEYISARLHNEHKIHSKVYSENPRKHRIYFWGNNAYALMELLYYDDSVQKLDRKYQKYLLLKK